MGPRLRGCGVAGVTLIEVLVAMAISVVVFGIALGILDTTSRGAHRQIDRESLWAEANLIAWEIEQALRAQIGAGEIQIAGGEAHQSFRPEEIQFYGSDVAQGVNLWRVKIGNRARPGVGANASRVAMIRLPAVGESSGREVARGAGRSLGAGGDLLSSRVEFRFAYRYEGLNPVWTETAQAGLAPRAVQFEVIVSHLEQDMPDVRLKGAMALNG